MSIFDRLHRFNTGLTGTVTRTATVIYNAAALIAGFAVIFFAWRLPGFYGFELTGWARFAPYAVTAAALYGIWDSAARIIEVTRAPPAPPPTTPDTW